MTARAHRFSCLLPLLVLVAADALTPRALGHRPRLAHPSGRGRPQAVLLASSAAGTLGAPQLVAGSALIAALMSLQAGALASRGVPTVTVAAACGGVAASLCFGAARRVSPPHGVALGLLVAQATLGGAMPHLAFFSISRCGLAVANCLMFTMPLWTGAFAALLDGAPWRRRDALLSLTSMLGVLLVAQPPLLAPLLLRASAAPPPFSAAGFGAGLAFGACGGLLNVLLATSDALRAASPALLNAWQMAASLALALPTLVTHKTPLGGVACSAPLLAGLALVGALMAATSAARTLGLQRAESSAVATLLYTEVAWCFALELLVLRAPLDPLKALGAGVILAGAALYAATP